MKSRPKILVVDDQPDNRLMLEDLLSSSYAVETAADGEQALALLQQPTLPDLVLLDVVMPGLDGFEVCRRLRNQTRTHALPVIFLSGLESASDEERGLSLGADDFIHKPFVPLLVLARVGNVIGQREAAERSRQIAVIEARLAEQQHNAAAMQAVINRLTVMNTELERFAFVAAHDLREPLRTVISFAQLLERHLGEGLDRAGRDYLRYIVEGARRMHDLIGGLSTYSHITTNIGPLRPVSAAGACRLALENLAPMIRETQAEIRVDDLPEVMADKLPLAQIFQILIGNAVKFHAPDRNPRVEVSAHLTGGEWVISVTDNGIGFNVDEQDVFELFRRLRPHSGPGGSGVGLAICKRIVQVFGGRVWVESWPDRGSVFSFALPAGRPSSGQNGDKSPEGGARRGQQTR